MKYVVIFVAVIGTLVNSRLAEATPITGDQFIVTFTQTSCDTFSLDIPPTPLPTQCPGGMGSVTVAELTLGAPAGPGFYSLASITAVQGGPPPLLSLDFSSVRFDAATLGLTGDILETFLGLSLGLHSDDLTLTDPGKTWILTDDHVSGGFTLTTNGTYTTAPVPEPSTLFLLGSGFAAIVARRRKSKG